MNRSIVFAIELIRSTYKGDLSNFGSTVWWKTDRLRQSLVLGGWRIAPLIVTVMVAKEGARQTWDLSM